MTPAAKKHSALMEYTISLARKSLLMSDPNRTEVENAFIDYLAIDLGRVKEE